MEESHKYDIRTINFGDKYHPARNLVRNYIEKNGKNALSKLIRDLIITALGNETKQLILERQRISFEVSKILENRREIDDKLRTRGINPEIDI